MGVEINTTDVGEVDHTRVAAPYVRVVTLSETLGVTLFDLRFSQPNVAFLGFDVLHSIEHMMAVSLRNILGDQFVNFGLMGCQTGFYLTVATDINCGDAIEKAILESLEMTSVPLCSKFECGNYLNHNLDGAKNALRYFLDCKGNWSQVYS